MSSEGMARYMNMSTTWWKYKNKIKVKKYLGSPSVHVEAAELLVARQPGVFALVVGLVGGGLHVEALVVGEALLIVCLVGLGDGGHRDFGL